jgi:hypothetical protein
MGEADRLFTDGQTCERLMGRWSRIAGQTFLDWLDAPRNLKWLDVGSGNGAFTEELIARSAPAACQRSIRRMSTSPMRGYGPA